jgi:septal ring factor EnvC (AmiA/AmiB activator)
MIFNRRARQETAALETAHILLEPLHELLPGVVNRVVQYLSGGRTLALGGQILVQGLVAWRDSVVEKEVQSALEQQEHRLTEIRSRENQQTKTILALQNKISSLEKTIEKQKLEKEFYQKTIQDQNSIVAEQHERLIALLGRARS